MCPSQDLRPSLTAYNHSVVGGASLAIDWPRVGVLVGRSTWQVRPQLRYEVTGHLTIFGAAPIRAAITAAYTQRSEDGTDNAIVALGLALIKAAGITTASRDGIASIGVHDADRKVHDVESMRGQIAHTLADLVASKKIVAHDNSIPGAYPLVPALAGRLAVRAFPCGVAPS